MFDTLYICIILILLIIICGLAYYNRRLRSRIDYSFFKEFLDNLNIPICVKDAYTQEVFYINEEYKRVFIHTNPDNLLMLAKLNLSKESYEAAKASETKLMENKAWYDSVEAITLSDGRLINTYTNKSIVNWKGTERILCIRYDVSEKQRVMNIDNLISRTIPSIKAFSWEMNSNTRTIKYSYGNNGFSGIERFDTIEKCLEIIHEDDRGKYKQSINDLLEKGNGYFSIEYRSCTSKARGYHWWELRCIAKTIHCNEGSYVHLYGLNIYMDEHKTRELQLIKQSEELELARNKAQESDLLKSKFLANMSHEIRTPLNAIIGFSEMLAESDNIADRNEYFSIIQFNNEILLKLINDIIELSKLETSLDLKPVRGSFALFFNQLAKSLQNMSSNSDVEFIIENPFAEAIATIDFSYIAQIINNFATNAIKNTTRGSITVGYSYQEDCEMLEVYVKDTGIGIPADKHNCIFERFNKLDQHKQGAGLGLNIVQAIVKQIGFECGFESSEQNGSYFWARGHCPLFIPASNYKDVILRSERSMTTECIKSSSTEKEDIPTIKILVVEDTDSNFDLVKAVLAHHIIVRALNGYEAVILAKENDFDLILMDIRMPLMDGLEATIEIKKLDKNTPIIALSANTFEADKMAAYEAGCDMYMEKPIRKQQIIELINSLVKDRNE